MTITTYLYDTYKFNDIARIIDISKDERGNYLLLDSTIFYPQGGGQPSDIGTIYIPSQNKVILISIVKLINKEIRHYTKNEKLPFSLINQEVQITIDSDNRITNAKYHTIGHLIGNLVEEINPEIKAIKGHQFPNEAYVEFSNILNAEIIQNLKKD
ncbi:MAG: hypothetical protein J0H68_03420 [Sphingobacteriia bacterium]|nr:hypothetical protein [Sphingobacteriia bacterium]